MCRSRHGFAKGNDLVTVGHPYMCIHASENTHNSVEILLVCFGCAWLRLLVCLSGCRSQKKISSYQNRIRRGSATHPMKKVRSGQTVSMIWCTPCLQGSSCTHEMDGQIEHKTASEIACASGRQLAQISLPLFLCGIFQPGECQLRRSPSHE